MTLPLQTSTAVQRCAAACLRTPGNQVCPMLSMCRCVLCCISVVMSPAACHAACYACAVCRPAWLHANWCQHGYQRRVMLLNTASRSWQLCSKPLQHGITLQRSRRQPQTCTTSGHGASISLGAPSSRPLLQFPQQASHCFRYEYGGIHDCRLLPLRPMAAATAVDMQLVDFRIGGD